MCSFHENAGRFRYHSLEASLFQLAKTTSKLHPVASRWITISTIHTGMIIFHTHFLFNHSCSTAGTLAVWNFSVMELWWKGNYENRSLIAASTKNKMPRFLWMGQSDNLCFCYHLFWEEYWGQTSLISACEGLPAGTFESMMFLFLFWMGYVIVPWRGTNINMKPSKR